MWVWVIVGLVVAVMAYVRLAPVNVAAGHVSLKAAEYSRGAGSAVRVVDNKPGLLSRIDAAMMSEPSTRRLAGSVAQGHVSYVSRSRWFGFPDITTVEEVAGQIRLFARLRFGWSDFGVNAARLKRVLRAAQAGG